MAARSDRLGRRLAARRAKLFGGPLPHSFVSLQRSTRPGEGGWDRRSAAAGGVDDYRPATGTVPPRIAAYRAASSKRLSLDPPFGCGVGVLAADRALVRGRPGFERLFVRGRRAWRVVGPVEAVVVGRSVVFGHAVAGVAGDVSCARAAGRSGEDWDRAEALDGCEELRLPGPAGGHSECHGAGGAGDPAGDGEQPAA